MEQFKQMTIYDAFKEYIDMEIPKFDGRWLTDQFHVHDPDQQTLEIIYDTLANQGKKKQRGGYNDVYDPSRDGRLHMDSSVHISRHSTVR